MIDRKKNNSRNYFSNTYPRRDVKGIKWVSTEVKADNLSQKFFNKKKEEKNNIAKKELFNFLNSKNKKDDSNNNLIENKESIKNFINRIIGKKEENKVRLKKNKNIIDVYKLINLKTQRCKKCHRIITEMSSAIQVDDSYYLHFDCALKDITEKKREFIKQNNKVVYLGSNIFGIVEFYKEEGKTKFKIKDKINLSKINVV